MTPHPPVTIFAPETVVLIQEDYCIGGEDFALEHYTTTGPQILDVLRHELFTADDPRDEDDLSEASAEEISGHVVAGEGACEGWWIADVTRPGCHSSRILFQVAS